MKAPLCKCNQCDTVMIDENPMPGAKKYEVKPEHKRMKLIEEENKTSIIGEPLYLKVCPECETDAYLTDL